MQNTEHTFPYHSLSQYNNNNSCRNTYNNTCISVVVPIKDLPEDCSREATITKPQK